MERWSETYLLLSPADYQQFRHVSCDATWACAIRAFRWKQRDSLTKLPGRRLRLWIAPLPTTAIRSSLLARAFGQASDAARPLVDHLLQLVRGQLQLWHAELAVVRQVRARASSWLLVQKLQSCVLTLLSTCGAGLGWDSQIGSLLTALSHRRPLALAVLECRTLRRASGPAPSGWAMPVFTVTAPWPRTGPGFGNPQRRGRRC